MCRTRQVLSPKVTRPYSIYFWQVQQSRSGTVGQNGGAGSAARAGTPSLSKKDSLASHGTKASANPLQARENSLFILETASAGLTGDSFGDLIGLPLLPMADGSLGRFLPPPPTPIDGAGDGAAAEVVAQKDVIFVCSAAERQLLVAGADGAGGGGGAGHRLLEDLENLSDKVKGLLTDKRLHAATNIAVMEPRNLAGMLGEVFPEAWKGLKQVAWAPGSRDVSFFRFFFCKMLRFGIFWWCCVCVCSLCSLLHDDKRGDSVTPFPLGKPGKRRRSREL